MSLGMVVHACNPNTWEVETGGLGVPGQPVPHSKILSQKRKIVSSTNSDNTTSFSVVILFIFPASLLV
jgi:hypothetical protein